MSTWLNSSWRLPVALLIAAVALGTALLPWPRALYLALTSEGGLVENATVLAALAGAALALSIWGLRGRLASPVLGAGFLLFALGLIFLAGEEISWGQQYLHWETPAGFAARNYQGETNLHNLRGVDVDAPAVVLGLGVFVGGIAWPLWSLMRRRSGVMGGWLGGVWPSARLWPAAIIALALWVTEVTLVQQGLDQSPALRTHYVAIREGVELFLIVYVLLYLADVRRRLGPREAGLVALTD